MSDLTPLAWPGWPDSEKWPFPNRGPAYNFIISEFPTPKERADAAFGLWDCPDLLMTDRHWLKILMQEKGEIT